MMESGTTGAHPNKDSQQSDGLGIEATGIIVATCSNGLMALGSDFKAIGGSNTEREYPLNLRYPEVQGYVDHSTGSKNGDFHHPWQVENFQGARLDKEPKPHTTCGKIIKLAISLEEDWSI